MFRYKRGIRCSYRRQAYIYGISTNYENLTRAQQETIRALCRQAGGDNAAAVFDFMTREKTATAVCLEHHIASRTTLYNCVKKYYENFPKRI